MPIAKLAAALLVLLLALVLGATPAPAETVNCIPVTSLPAVITVQGVHCFTGDLTTSITSGSAIDIQTNNVVLDLNGFKLGGLAAGLGTTAFGISANDRQNLTIKNGTIRGFFAGIILGGVGGQGYVVEDIRADQNTFEGIQVYGSGNIVRNNQVVATGQTTTNPNADAYGIRVGGNGPRVLNNDVIKTVATGGFGTSWGILLDGAIGGLMVNNRITTADRGIDYSTLGATGSYRDNLTFDVSTPFLGGTAVGTND